MSLARPDLGAGFSLEKSRVKAEAHTRSKHLFFSTLENKDSTLTSIKEGNMYSPLNTPDFIALYARSYPEKKAITDLTSGTRWHYSALDYQIRQMASLLIARGCLPGDRIALLARNSVQQVIVHFACARLGIIYTPLNWRLSSVELSGLIDCARPKFIVCDEQSATLLATGHNIEHIKDIIQEAATLTPTTDFSCDPDRTSLMLFTSGTSGSPKGVMLSERNLNQSGVNFGVLSAVDGNSCFLCEAPLFHVLGMVANIRTVLQHGGHIYISDGYKAERTLSWLCDETMAITHYTGVPQMIERFRSLPNFDPAPLRRVLLITGGAPHSLADKQAWLADGITLVSGSGMTEVGTTSGMPPNPDLIARKLGSVGLFPPGMQARLVDNDGRDVPPGESGELWLRGDSITQGYWEDEEKTQSVFAEGRWFMTGDIVTIDEDGYCWIIDRKKDMFISGGENVYPAEIETVAINFPGLVEVAVIGVPDKKWGEVGCLVVVCAEGEAVAEERLLHFLRERLATYKVPKYLVVQSSLPRTKSTGKLQKQELKRSLLDDQGNFTCGN